MKRGSPARCTGPLTPAANMRWPRDCHNLQNHSRLAERQLKMSSRLLMVDVALKSQSRPVPVRLQVVNNITAPFPRLLMAFLRDHREPLCLRFTMIMPSTHFIQLQLSTYYHLTVDGHKAHWRNRCLRAGQRSGLDKINASPATELIIFTVAPPKVQSVACPPVLYTDCEMDGKHAQ